MEYRKRRMFRRNGYRGRGGRRIYIRYLLILCAVLFLCLQLDHLTRRQLQKEQDTDHVPSAELAGYLQVIPLTPEETRALILPEMEEYITGEGVYALLDFLKLNQLAEDLRQERLFQETEELTCETWCGVYERMLAALGLAEQIQVTEIQYLGMLLEENRLMADSGNYDCDPESVDFVYGETYSVYICGNLLLGKAAAAPGQESGGEEAAGQETAGEPAGNGASGQTPEDGTAGGQEGAAVPESVRVLLTQDNGEKAFRKEVYLTGDQGLSAAVPGQEQKEQRSAGQVLDCREWMEARGTDTMTVSAGENGRIYVTDASGKAQSAGYRGSFRLSGNEKGIWIVNEISLEEYLCGVVPGEMPEAFAPEAQKAQAVCARTYAARLIAGKKYEAYAADLDDTTDCQVYQPEKENAKAAEAVKATAAQVLTYQGALAELYYFSTSCGMTSGPEVWQMEGKEYLKPVSLLSDSGLKIGETVSADDFLRRGDIKAYDSESRYFRWTVRLDLSSSLSGVLEAVRKEIDSGSGKVGIEGGAGIAGLGGFQGLSAAARNASGTVTDCVMQFENGRVHLYHENTIRTVLGKAMVSVTDKNGKTEDTLRMVPSAAFSVEDSGNGQVTLYGGGLGHGIGMSQYGADGMAREGKNFREILSFFFPGTEISGG